ncbi:MAG TPA: hypothetical protein VM008_20620 [Phycisphaerae bacterium]|nr:hypothetical protein [Phycisphaerae bacterium]
MYPTLWQGAQPILLPLPVGQQGDAQSINNAGDAVGLVYTLGPNTDERPALWHNGQLQLLSTLNQSSGAAAAINNAGFIAGSVSTNVGPNTTSQAILWTPTGQPTLLTNLPNTQAFATAINNNNQVLTVASSATGVTTSIWSNNTSSLIPDLGDNTLAGHAINDLGHVAGAAVQDNVTVAFLYKEGTTAALPGLPGGSYAEAMGINDSDEIVGFGDNSTGDSVAILWQDGSPINLNDLIPANTGWQLFQANAITDDGSILGNGLFNGQATPFLLTPTTTSSTSSLPTPEPATICLLGIAIPLLLKRRH